MAKIKFDGVIEAVRYDDEGKIAQVRGYIRRGEAFTDRMIWTRDELDQLLVDKKTFYTGERQYLIGGVFTPGSEIKRLETNLGMIISTGSTQKDDLGETPLF